jgi:hypothetical protein
VRLLAGDAKGLTGVLNPVDAGGSGVDAVAGEGFINRRYDSSCFWCISY